MGAATATEGGSFFAPLDVPDLAVGRHRVAARCGPVMATNLDLVLVTRVDPATTTLAVLVYFVLLALAVVRRQLGTVRTGR